MIVSYYLLPGPVTSIDFCGMRGGVSKIFQFVLSLPIIVSGSPVELPYAPWDCTVYLRDADRYSIHRAYGKYVQKAYTFLILLCGDRDCLYCDNQTLQTSEHVFVSSTICDALKTLNKFVQLFLRNCWLKDMNISCVYPHNSAIVRWNAKKNDWNSSSVSLVWCIFGYIIIQDKLRHVYSIHNHIKKHVYLYIA